MWQWVRTCLMRVLQHMHCIELNRQDVLLHQRKGIFTNRKYPEMRYGDLAREYFDSPGGRVVLEDYAEPIWSDGEEEDLYEEFPHWEGLCPLVSSGETLDCCKPCIKQQGHRGPAKVRTRRGS